MAALTPEQRDELRAASGHAAAAFLEDIRYFRDILNRDEVSAAEIRRASVTLRRLLTDREIHAIASPRIGRFLIEMPKPRPAHLPVPAFYLHGGMGFGGMQIAACGIFPGKAFNDSEAKSEYEEWKPASRESARLDNFLSAFVLPYGGMWLTRAQVILFIANLSSGAHSGTPKEPHERVLAIIRRVAKINHPRTGKPFLAVTPDAVKNSDSPLLYSANEIDAVLFELMATMHFLVHTPDTSRLETAIRDELTV
jgi:hypothetical protein